MVIDAKEANMPESVKPIIAGTRIGHVHLKVADLDRALAFYCGVLGFEVMQRLSSGAAFISGSTPGKAKAAIRRRRAPPDCFTRRSFIRRGRHSPMHCIG